MVICTACKNYKSLFVSCTEHKVTDDKSVVSSLVRIPDDAAIFVL